MPNLEIFLKLVDVVKMKGCQRSRPDEGDAHIKISYSYSGAASSTHPSSLGYALEEPSEEDAEAAHVGGKVTEYDDDD